MDPAALPYTIVIPTRYGQMIVNRHDVYQTTALIKTGGAHDPGEVDLLVSIIKMLGERRVVLDVGANFGMHSLAFARALGPHGKVHAFEAQRIIFNMLAGSVALNALPNVYCHHMAVGDREGAIEIPQFDYSKPLNFGGVEFGAEQHEKLEQERGHDPENVETVALTTLDRFNFEQVSLMKIDVEGMEMQVLDGAQNTIKRCRPVIYVEFLKVDRQALHDRIAGMGYDVHLNAINLLCIPTELRAAIPLQSQ